MLTRSGESGHPFSFLILRGKLSVFQYDISCGLFINPYYVKEVPAIVLIFEHFYYERVLEFVKCFNQDNNVFFPFILFMWCITLIDFHMRKYLCILGINPRWSW